VFVNISAVFNATGSVVF